MCNAFKEYADGVLAPIGMDERMKNSVRRRAQASNARPVPRKRTLGLALAGVLLVCSVTAFALTGGFGLFDLPGAVSPRLTAVRPEADRLLQKNLSHYSFEHVDVAVREAAYDGRYLRVAYAVTDRAATAPLAESGTLLSSMAPAFRFEAAEKDGVSWPTLDGAQVNGQEAQPAGISFSVAGENNGEAVTWVQFDVRGMTLPDTFRVRLPFREQDTPDELDFTFAKGDMSTVYALAAPDDKRIGDYAVHIESITVSPIRTYVTAHLIVDAGASPERCMALADRWKDAVLSDADGGQPRHWTDTAFGPLDNLQSVEVTGADGAVSREDRIMDKDRPVTMRVDLEFAPPEKYPEAFRLGVDAEQFILIPFVRAKEV